MTVKVLGTGCPNCKKLEKLALKAIKEAGVSAEVEKVTDIQTIMNDYKVMSTPALVVNDEVVIKGRVPSYKEVLSAIQA